MFDHFIDACVICHCKTFEAPLFSQHICQQKFICRCRHSIHFIERCHHTSCACINSSFVWRQIFIVHANTAHIGCIVIATGFCCAIQRIMFYASHNICVLRKITLVTFHRSEEHTS